MSNYLIKIGNLYYAGTHDFTTEQGYLDRQHPRVLIKLNKFDFNATQFASEKRKVTKSGGNSNKI